MSQFPFDDVTFLQRFLKAGGFYRGAIDGLRGPKTNDAIERFQKEIKQNRTVLGSFDDRSEQNIATLIPSLQVKVRMFLKRLSDAGIQAKILSGTRSYAEQDTLFAQGRTTPGAKVTNARGGQSNHNFGIAFDIGIFVSGKYLSNGLPYQEAGRIGQQIGLEWGGSWKTFKDLAHFQLNPTLTLAQIRQRFEGGEQGWIV